MRTKENKKTRNKGIIISITLAIIFAIFMFVLNESGWMNEQNKVALIIMSIITVMIVKSFTNITPSVRMGVILICLYIIVIQVSPLVLVILKAVNNFSNDKGKWVLISELLKVFFVFSIIFYLLCHAKGIERVAIKFIKEVMKFLHMFIYHIAKIVVKLWNLVKVFPRFLIYHKKVQYILVCAIGIGVVVSTYDYLNNMFSIEKVYVIMLVIFVIIMILGTAIIEKCSNVRNHPYMLTLGIWTTIAIVYLLYYILSGDKTVLHINIDKIKILLLCLALSVAIVLLISKLDIYAICIGVCFELTICTLGVFIEFHERFPNKDRNFMVLASIALLTSYIMTIIIVFTIHNGWKKVWADHIKGRVSILVVGGILTAWITLFYAMLVIRVGILLDKDRILNIFMECGAYISIALLAVLWVSGIIYILIIGIKVLFYEKKDDKIKEHGLFIGFSIILTAILVAFFLMVETDKISDYTKVMEGVEQQWQLSLRIIVYIYSALLISVVTAFLFRESMSKEFFKNCKKLAKNEALVWDIYSKLQKSDDMYVFFNSIKDEKYIVNDKETFEMKGVSDVLSVYILAFVLSIRNSVIETGRYAMGIFSHDGIILGTIKDILNIFIND